MEPLEFRILGPFEIRRGDVVLDGGAGRPQALLVTLLLNANRTVSPARLSDAVWGERAPRSTANLIQGYVSHWRSMLDPARAPRSSGHRLQSTPGGYQLALAADECDLSRFRRLARDGERAAAAGDLLVARRLLALAVAERRGPPLGDFRDVFHVEGAALEAEWLAAVRTAAGVELQLGAPERALAHLDQAAAREPLDETLAEMRMLALYRLGRQAESLAVYDQVRVALADDLGVEPGVRLRTLHVRVLRQDASLRGPERVAATAPTLPVPLSSFVGRRRELAAVLAVAGSHRLVTLTGSGGSGKTRLAIEVAREVAAEAQRDVTFVDLSAVRTSDQLWPTVANVLGTTLAAGLEPAVALAAALRSRPGLLVLDNLEQLTGAGPEIARVLSLSPQLAVLATSREPLGVDGEHLFAVPPLPVPSDDDDPSAVMSSDAVRLFVQRSAAADPAFELTGADAAVAGGICRRLDGLPLAVELAAAWTTTLSLRALLERLDRPLDLLVRSRKAGSGPPRHRTMRAAIEWSYSALGEPERRLLDELSVFVSGARLDAIEAVSDLGEETLQSLAELVDRNLVTRITTGLEPRYRLLQTIREYARGELAARPEDQRAAKDRHAGYFSVVAEQVARTARSPGGETLVARLGDEQHEIRAALGHLRRSGSPDRVLALVTDCLPLWWDLGFVAEGYTRLTEALDACGDAPTELRAAAHAGAASLGEAVADRRTALGHARTATALAMRAGSLPLEGLGCCLEGNNLSWEDWAGPATEGIERLESARRISGSMPAAAVRWDWSSRQSVLATATISLVDVLRHRDARRAHALLAGAVDEGWTAEPHLASFVRRAFGFLAADAGSWLEAEQHLVASLALARQAGSTRSESRTLEELARLAWARGAIADAAAFAEDATRLSRNAGHAINWARCAALLSDVLSGLGDRHRAWDLLAEAEPAVGTRDAELAAIRFEPRRARLARLDGDSEGAARHVGAASALASAEMLTPDRVIYLVESAYAAAGDPAAVASIGATIDTAAERVGLRLPEPERRLLDDLTGG